MNQTAITFLTDFLQLLETEKEALMKNDGSAIITIVKEKEVFVEAFPTMDFKNVDQKEVTRLVGDIRQLQETNLLLTKQSLRFHETVMEALSQGAQKNGKTYSKQGQKTGLDQANLLNQSL